MFDQISVDLDTGKISYPKITGFVLDMEQVYRAVPMMAAHCSTKDAVRHAIHQQLAAFRGLQGLRK